MEKIRILRCNPEPNIAHRCVFSSKAMPDIQLIGSAGTSDEVVQAFAQEGPELVLMGSAYRDEHLRLEQSRALHHSWRKDEAALAEWLEYRYNTPSKITGGAVGAAANPRNLSWRQDF
jgi:hypothetical protein